MVTKQRINKLHGKASQNQRDYGVYMLTKQEIIKAYDDNSHKVTPVGTIPLCIFFKVFLDEYSKQFADFLIDQEILKEVGQSIVFDIFGGQGFMEASIFRFMVLEAFLDHIGIK